jgi:hypothetical protein
MGAGYMVAEDDHDSHPNAVKRWELDKLTPRLLYHATEWGTGVGHISHTNVRRPAFVCISNASTQNQPRANEVIQVRLDGRLFFRALAPTMVDLNRGEPYRLMPKGNLCPYGEYFIWTANRGTEQLDAFLVRVPPW